jgi:hypothetical protein
MKYDLFGQANAKEDENARSARCIKTRERHELRCLTSEDALYNCIADWHWRKGYAYHVISTGDVDAMSFIMAILKQQPVDYLLVSTWVISSTDIKQLHEQIDRGNIKRIDIYLGEISEGRDPDVTREAIEVTAKTGGRMVRFKNHSKVTVAYGKRFTAVVESSANLNTNPRSENTVVTINEKLADFYKEFFDHAPIFNRYDQPEDWQPW